MEDRAGKVLGSGNVPRREGDEELEDEVSRE